MARIIASMLDFIRTQAVGPVRVGVSRDMARAALGDPDSEDIFGVYNSPGGEMCRQIERHGNLDLQYTPGIWMIEALGFSLWDYELPSAGPLVDFDPWIIRRGASPAEIAAGLVSQGIEQMLWFQPETGCPYINAPGVTFHFKKKEGRRDEYGLVRVGA
jgi:hypothetical protein